MDWREELRGQGQRRTFVLCPGVKFHDSSDWNCSTLTTLCPTRSSHDLCLGRSLWTGFPLSPRLSQPGLIGTKWNHLEETVTCVGLSNPVGTGPFKLVNRTYLPGSNNTIDQEVVFARHNQYWGGPPQIKNLVIKHYDNSDAVYSDLLGGDLDMVLGNGPLRFATFSSSTPPCLTFCAARFSRMLCWSSTPPGQACMSRLLFNSGKGYHDLVLTL